VSIEAHTISLAILVELMPLKMGRFTKEIIDGCPRGKSINRKHILGRGGRTGFSEHLSTAFLFVYKLGSIEQL
jgi:hypothetical protein